jgi:hypothetical protein
MQVVLRSAVDEVQLNNIENVDRFHFNPSVYTIIANRLAQTHYAQNKRRPRGDRVRSLVA